MKHDEFILKSPADGRIILRIYYSTAEAGRRPYLEHHHTECEISSILEGSCEWQVRRQPISCAAGDILLFGSDEEHYITSISSGAPLKILNLRFEPRFIWSAGSDLFDSRYLSIFLNHGPDFSNHLAGGSPAARQIFPLVQQILTECRREEPEYELIVKARLMLILGLLGRHYAQVLQTQTLLSGIYLQQMDDALNYIDANLTRELTLEEIIQAAGMSRSHFSSVFKALNGVSVWTYITNKRIELALHHIRRGRMSITQIAMECGFNTMSNFNRSFKKVTHCTPSEYKRSLRSLT